ncbi:unnamed protein product [Cladocopium goreaui]|uniref:J domain-containing protein n=1 Tax=Cladocopium goreaui TaxID=2562237 RepID=A0A9P1BVW7_9DINO|nr:unnamed protein product [Cladocopium goreaui]
MPRLRAFFASREANLPSKSEADLPEKPTSAHADVQDEVTDGGHQVASKAADSESDSGDSWPPLDAGDEAREGDRADLNSDSGDSWPPLDAGDEAREGDRADLNSCEKLEADLPELATDVADVADVPLSDGGHQVASKAADSESDSGESWPPLDAGEEARESDKADVNREEARASDRADVNSDSDESWPPLDAVNLSEMLETDVAEAPTVPDVAEAPTVPDVQVSDLQGAEAQDDGADSNSDSDESWPPLDAVNQSEMLETDVAEAPIVPDVAEAPTVPDVQVSDLQGAEAQEDGADSNSESGDSLPPLEFIPKSEQENVEVLGPGDLVQLVDLRMTDLNGEQGYILRLVPGHKEERVEVKMLSTGKMLSVKRSNVRSVAAQQERSQRSQRAERTPRSRSEPRPLRRGDEVVVQGLTKAVEYNGQRALVTEIVSSAPGRVTVELLRSGRQMSLRRDKLRVMVELSESEDEDDEDLADLPPLRCIRPKMTAESKFQIGQKVWLHMKQKPEYHGQQVFVLPSDPLKGTGVMATVQLSNGKRIITKESHLKEDPPEPLSKGSKGSKVKGRKKREI